MDLEGIWRIEMSVRSTADVAMLKGIASTTVTVGVVEVARDGEGLVHRQRACAVDIRDDNPLSRTVLPPALVAVLPPSHTPVELSDGRYVVDLGTSHLGYLPGDGDALPLSADDPAVVDVDGDGRPGATVRVQIAAVGDFGVDVVQRSHALLEGRLDGDAIRGAVRTLDFAQGVLGADLGLLRRGPTIHPDDDASTFVMTRLPVGAGCAEAVGAGSGG